MAKERLPFELAKPSNDTFVTETSEIGHNGQPLDEVLEELDNISKQSAQSEEQAVVFETDGGVQVGKIDANGADFVNLKKNGQNVATENQIPSVPTLDTSIGSSPSNSHTPSTKAVKEYVDDNIPEVPEYPIETETTQSEAEEQVWCNDAETQEYVKVGSYGMKSKAYLDMQGDSIIDDEIGNTPSISHAPSAKAVADYFEAHGGGGTGDFPISKESILSENEEQVWGNNAGTQEYVKIGPYGMKSKAYLDMNGNPIGGGSVSVQTISGKNYLVFS